MELDDEEQSLYGYFVVQYLQVSFLVFLLLAHGMVAGHYYYTIW